MRGVISINITQVTFHFQRVHDRHRRVHCDMCRYWSKIRLETITWSIHEQWIISRELDSEQACTWSKFKRILSTKLCTVTSIHGQFLKPIDFSTTWNSFAWNCWASSDCWALNANNMYVLYTEGGWGKRKESNDERVSSSTYHICCEYIKSSANLSLA